MTRGSTQAVPRAHWPVTLARGLRDRANWVMFAIGLGTGIPIGWAWYALPSWSGARDAYPLEILIANELLGSFTVYSLLYLAALVLAPLLDRQTAPFFRRLGARPAWTASSLAAALVLTIVFVAVTAALPGNIAASVSVVYGYVAFVVLALLFAAVTAFRIELRPGRKQAIAFGAQYLGAFIGQYSGFLAGTGGSLSYPYAGLCVVLLAFALWSVIYHAKLPAQPAADDDAFSGARVGVKPARGPLEAVARSLADPWTALFRRHRGSAILLLAAIALFGLAASAATFASGYLVNLAAPSDQDAARLMAEIASTLYPFGLVVSLGGLVAGVAVALARAAPRAFGVLQATLIAFAIVFLVCKFASGQTALTVAVVLLAHAFLVPFASVIFAVVLAGLVAPPHTAGQAMIVFTFATVFSPSSSLLTRIAGEVGSIGLAVLVMASAAAARLCMLGAGRLARRPVALGATPPSD